MSTHIYATAIQDTWIYLLLNMLPLLIGGVVLIILSLIGLFKKLMNKSIVFVLLVLGIIVFAYSVLEISLFKYDVLHENFAVYYGEFDYMQVSGNRKDVFEFSENSDLYIRSVADLGISTGSHCGYILYGESSHWAILYSMYPIK